jgi:virulence-associated protein VapD
MGSSNSRTLSKIIDLYEDSLVTNLKDLVFDIKQQLDNTGFYAIYGELKVQKNETIEKINSHYELLKNLLNLNSDGAEKVFQDIANIAEPSMDEHNKKAVYVLNNEGMDKAVEHMFTREDGSTRSYSEMRMLYG